MGKKRVDYKKAKTPADYVCDNCGATGVKLWREYQRIAIEPKLLCADCAAQDQNKDISDIDADGRHGSEYGGRTDQIGWYMPAVPDEEGFGYWGYASVPEAGVNWWRNLPTKK